MLKPKVNVEEFSRFGFKPCKGIEKELKCYYLCVARGVKMLFVSPVIFDIQDWEDNDPRIHSVPNCKYRDHRTTMDIVYQLIKADMLKGDWEE